MAGGGAVVGLAAVADADEAAFADEALEEAADAVGRERQLEGVADIFVRDGVVVGEESCETLVDLVVLGVEDLAVGGLVDRETLDLGQQLAVGLEVNAADVNIATVIVAVLHLDLALERETEGADAGQRDGIALLHFVEHDALQKIQRMCQFSR